MVEAGDNLWIRNTSHYCGPFLSKGAAEAHRRYCETLSERVLYWSRSGRCEVCFFPSLPEGISMITMPFGTKDCQRVNSLTVMVLLKDGGNHSETK